MGVLAQLGVELLDVEQVVIRGRLTLGVLVAAVPDVEDLTDCVDEAMAAAGLKLRAVRLKRKLPLRSAISALTKAMSGVRERSIT